MNHEFMDTNLLPLRRYPLKASCYLKLLMLAFALAFAVGTAILFAKSFAF